MTIQYYTYLYTDPKDGTPVYVGKGKAKRAYEHLKPHGKGNKRLQNMLRKRRLSGYNPQPIINYEPDEQTALEMEKFWIAFFGRKDLGKGTLFNLTDGGDGLVNPSNGTKTKISKTHKERGIAPRPEYRGYNLTPEQEARRIAASQSEQARQKHREHANYRYADLRAQKEQLKKDKEEQKQREKQLREELKLQEKLARPGRGNLTPEQRAKQSAALKGKPKSKEHVEKVRQAMIGHKVDESTKSKISQTLLSNPKLTCPHCSKQGSSSTMKRWHFDNCKSK